MLQSDGLRMLIFLTVASLGSFAMVALFAVGSESWQDDFPHKIQYGLFPFWQMVDDGTVSGARSSNVLYAGVVETVLAGAGVILIVCVAWVGLIGTRLRREHQRDDSTLPFEL